MFHYLLWCVFNHIWNLTKNSRTTRALRRVVRVDLRACSVFLMFPLGKVEVMNQLFKVGLTSGPTKHSQISAPLFEPQQHAERRPLDSAAGWKHATTVSDWLSVNDNQRQCELSARHHSVSESWCRERRDKDCWVDHWLLMHASSILLLLLLCQMLHSINH